MNPLTVKIALDFVREHWARIGSGLAVLFWLLLIRGCAENAQLSAELKACLSKPPQVQFQTVTVTAKATQSVRIIYRDGSPCPDVLADNSTETGATVAQGQSSQSGATQRILGPWSVTAGGAIYRGGAYIALGGGYWRQTSLGDLGIEVTGLFPPAWDDSQSTRRPVAIIGLTARP
jgi:hypothetical protein